MHFSICYVILLVLAKANSWTVGIMANARDDRRICTAISNIIIHIQSCIHFRHCIQHTHSLYDTNAGTVKRFSLICFLSLRHIHRYSHTRAMSSAPLQCTSASATNEWTNERRTADDCVTAHFLFFFWHEAQLTVENMLSVIIVVEWIVRHKDVKIHRNGYICHPKWILSCLGASKEPCACVCVWPGPVTSMYDALIHIIIWYTGIISCFCLRFSVHNTVRAQCIWGSYRALDS